MKLSEITDRINNKIENSSILCDFQKLRREIKGKKRGTNLFFGKNATHDDYAFHYGGRHEIQFNIGDDQDGFRYGLAFSLEPGQDLTDPIDILSPKIIRFNEYMNRNMSKYEDLLMWRWHSEGRDDARKISLISKEWIDLKSFIFIGNFINKKSDKINDRDIDIIIKKFEEIYPIYEYIELQQSKISKICWNTNMWIKPSGLEGKSLDKNSYERINRFGHEEWLFDFNKIINNYHYAALQPIGKYRDKYSNKQFDIRLYTYNSGNKKWYWVAKINNVVAICETEAKKAYEHYKKNGWLNEMEEDLKLVKAEYIDIETFNEYILNIKFKPGDVEFYEENGIVEFYEDEKISHNRYTLLNDNIPPVIRYENIKYEIIRKDDSFETKTRSILRVKKQYSENPIEFNLLHGAIQDEFYLFLQQKFPNDSITKEAHITGINKSIDIYQEKKDGTKLLYEVKSYSSLELSLKIAIGQMLEYAYFPDRNKRFKLLMVSHKEIKNRIKKYIVNLNKLLNINLGIIHFDIESKEIINSINYEQENGV